MTLFSISFAALLSGCSFLPTQVATNGESVPYAGYIAINPISLPHDLFEAPKATGDGTPQTDTDLNFLINNAARVSIQEISADGEIKYIASGVSSKDHYYHSTIDYIKYHSSSIKLPIDIPGTSDEKLSVIIGVAVGVGLRAEATFTASEKGVNIADIINIGASAQAKKISGTMAFQTMGIESKAISDTLPIPSELSTSTIQNALQTMATVKANIYSPETNVVPQIVGIEIQSYPDGVKVSDIIKSLHRNKFYLADQVKEELNQRGYKFSN